MIDHMCVYASTLYSPNNYFQGRRFSSKSIPGLISEILDDAIRKTPHEQIPSAIFINNAAGGNTKNVT